MASIAREARVSKSTLYARFASKADLFRAIIDNQIKSTDAAVQRHVPRSSGSLDAELRAYGERALRASLEQDGMHINRLIYGESARFPELAQMADLRHKIGVARIAERLRNAMEVDGFVCSDVDGAAEILAVMFRGWYDQILVSCRSVSAHEIRKAVARMVRAFMASKETW